MQFIIGSNRHQINFSIPDDRVGGVYPARLMLLCKMVALLSQKKQAFCLPANLKTKTDNSKTSRLPRFRSIALSFLSRWAKRKFSSWQ